MLQAQLHLISLNESDQAFSTDAIKIRAREKENEISRQPQEK